MRKELFIAGCATLLFASMVRLYAGGAPSGDHTYILHVEQVECDKSHMQMQNAATDEFPAVVMVAYEDMIAFPDSKAVKFPDLKLVPGQQGEIDQQKPVKYPSAFDADGKPVEFSVRGVGMKISATISAVTNAGVMAGTTNDFVFLSYRAENVIGPLSTNEVEKTRVANPKLKDDKSPWFQSKNMNGDIELSLGQWYVLGGMVAGETRYMTYFIKVEKK